MSEIKRTFLQGKMDKNRDERLVPQGEYVDALNIQVAKSEGSDVGAIENSLGNIQKTFHGLTNAKCIGSLADHANQHIYYFVTADEKDFVAEYDDASQFSVMLLESTRINGKTILNFQKDKLITGVSKIISGTRDNDLLAWTDDNEQPRIINIERAKTYGVDGFEEDDISLIKKPPIFAPQMNLTYVSQGQESNINDKFLSFAYAYRYLDGEMSALSPFTSAAFSPGSFKLDHDTFENKGMQNIFSAVDVKFNTGSKRVTDVMLVFKETTSNTVYVVETFNKKNNQWEDNEEQTFRFSNSKIYRVLDQDELFRLFDNVPRKAKAQDVIGNRLAFANYLEGYDLLDSFGEKLKIDYNLSLFTKNLEGKPVTYELLQLNVENDLLTIDLSGISLKQNTRLRFGIELREKDGGTGTYSGDFDFVINEDFATVKDIATYPDFIRFVEEVLTQGFLTGYTTTPPANSELEDNATFLIDSYSPTSITLWAPSLIFKVDNTPGDSTDEDFSRVTRRWGFSEGTKVFFNESASDSSCKTNRSYEAAIIYLDEYGRGTTALTAADNTLYIPQSSSIFQNKIRVNVNHKPPVWAKYYRFALKQNKKEYQTIYATVFYEEGLFRWVKLDGANKDKVQIGDTLIVKSDLSGPVKEVVKVRVLDIKTQLKDFLESNETTDGELISETEGIYMKIKIGAYDMNYIGDTFRTLQTNIATGKNDAPIINFTPLGYINADGVYQDYKINAGTSIQLAFRNWKNGGFIGYTAEEVKYEKEFIANESYDNFEEWFNAEVKDFGSKASEFAFARNAAGELELHIKGTVKGGGWENPAKMHGQINFRFTEGVVVFETEPDDALSDIYYEGSQTFNIIDGRSHEGNIQDQTPELPAVVELDFFNCFAMGNGVESYRYKDALNGRYLNIDTRPTAKSQSEYREIRRYADITYGAPYEESLGINGLNNFNLSTSNYKDDIVKKYGSIQKLIARDTDLLVFQEDKVSRVLYGKELVVSPDGAANLTSVDEVLGTQVPYAGEHGVSRNPESIAMAGTRVWWTDEKRNQVCRLSLDGITVISRYGMTSWFRDMFTASMNRMKLGAYDPYNQKYVLGSNTQLIYNPLSKFDCSQQVRKQNFTGDFQAQIDFGISTGEVGINIITNKEITVQLIWNNIVYSEIINGAGSLFFDKTSLLPRFAELTITTPENTNFEISGQCAIIDKITVISVIRGHDFDSGKIIANRYKWVFQDYPGPLRTFRETFIEGGGVALYNVLEGDEGIGYVPKTGATVFMDSYKGIADTATFGPDDTIGYLVSDTLYSESEVDALIAAAEMVSPPREVTGGGEIIHKTNFDFLRPNREKYLYLIWDYSSLSVNINTRIFIYFDSSGSMNSTLAPLIKMRDTILKTTLLPLYENDEARYDAQVKVISNSSERTLHLLNFLNEAPPEGNVISLIFQDEANPVYHTGVNWNTSTERTTAYNSDMSVLRNRLNSFNPNYYRGVIFHVDTRSTNPVSPLPYEFDNFRNLILGIQNGAGNYSGINGLSGRSEFNFKYDLTPGASSEYYNDQITTALRELGFSL